MLLLQKLLTLKLLILKLPILKLLTVKLLMLNMFVARNKCTLGLSITFPTVFFCLVSVQCTLRPMDQESG